ncbi:MAG: FtsX-like permease family protein [Oscillospiraceae bacterium]|nr:FtsX-like permease family protein [Oscillospiraceae bacterium]
MKLSTHLKSLYRSPLRSLLSLLLLAAAAFLFLYNLSEYSVAEREYAEAKEQYEGVLTVEEQPVPDNTDNLREYFLLSDETNPGNTYGMLEYLDYHQKSLNDDLIKALAALPHISRVEERYLTAGVSSSYVRLDTDTHYFPFFARAVLTATVKYHMSEYTTDSRTQVASWETIVLEDVQVLGGDPAWLKGQELQTVKLHTFKDEYRNQFFTWDGEGDYSTRSCMYCVDKHLFEGDADILQPGRRVLLVLRNNCVDQRVVIAEGYQDAFPSAYRHVFHVGDDSLADWWPYFTDITGLPENWLETDEFADLRELIQVTNDDMHTFDVVYCDDMAAQRRAASGFIVCEEGRFLTPEDAGQPVCVVNTDVLDAYELKVGDSITLDLGNYLSEQYAPLGAVVSNRGRQNTAYITQTFTIVGAWRDLSEGNHTFRDRYWCWSNNAIFVPTAFLPECRNAENHEFKPSEVSFVVGNAEEITAFVEECLPLVEAMGLTYNFSDSGWLLVAKDLMLARSLARSKLLIFAGAALFALVLTVWLFIGRKKREYGILRALGMGQREASYRLFVPFFFLGTLATVLGLLAARIIIANRLAASDAAHVTTSPVLFLLGGLGFLVLLAVMAFVGLLLIRRESILSLTQEKQK